jgi:hypothetical protein
MAQHLISIIFSISGFCLGWRIITEDGMILGFLRRFFIEHVHPVIAKPFILCITCTSSVWGTIIFWIFFAYSDYSVDIFTIFEWIFCCIVCSFINTILWQLKIILDKITNKS